MDSPTSVLVRGASFTKIGECKQLTAPVTPVELDPHANRPPVMAVGQKTDLARPQRRFQLVLRLQIRVRVSLYYLKAQKRRGFKYRTISIFGPARRLSFTKPVGASLISSLSQGRYISLEQSDIWTRAPIPALSCLWYRHIGRYRYTYLHTYVHIYIYISADANEMYE